MVSAELRQKWQDLISFAVPYLGISQAAIIRIIEPFYDTVISAGQENELYPVGRKTHLSDDDLFTPLMLAKKKPLWLEDVTKDWKVEGREPQDSLWRFYVGFPLFGLHEDICGMVVFFGQQPRQLDEASQKMIQLIHAQIQSDVRIDDLHQFIADLEQQTSPAVPDFAGQHALGEKTDKKDFISKISHELKTPITAVREGLSIVADGVVGEVNQEQKDFLLIARRNVDKLTKLVNDIVYYQKLHDEIYPLSTKDVNIYDLIENIQQYVASLIDQKDLIFETQLPDDLPQLKCDFDRIQYTLKQLVYNAIQHTEKGSIHLLAQQDDNTVHFIVRDTGCGIQPEYSEKIFECFEKVAISRQGLKGSGLGLFICREIVNKHKGRIWVESVPGEGSSFHVVLPVRERRQ